MKYFRWFLALVCVVLLILVRHFETRLFYDPLLDFFHSDYHNIAFPSLNLKEYVLSISSRYWLNSLLSLAVIFLIFKNKAYLKLSALIYLVAYILFFALYLYFIHTEFSLGYTAGFYVRRIIIQPVLLLLLIPIFIYTKNQKRTEK